MIKLFDNKIVNSINKNLKLKPKIFVAFLMVCLLLVMAGIQEFICIHFLRDKAARIEEIGLIKDPLTKLMVSIQKEENILHDAYLLSDNVDVLDVMEKSRINREEIIECSDQLILMSNSIQKSDNDKTMLISMSLEDLKNDYLSSLRTAIDDYFTLTLAKNDILIVLNNNLPRYPGDSVESNIENLKHQSTLSIKKINEKMLFIESKFNNLGNKIDAIRRQLTFLDERELQAASDMEKYVTYIILMGILFGLFIAILIASFISKRITDPVMVLCTNVELLEKGEFPDKLSVIDNDEIGLMTTWVNKLSQKLREIALFAKEVGNNNFDTEVHFDATGTLGESLINMRDSLKKAKIETEKASIEDEKRNWTTEGLAKFGEILRNNNNDLEKLGDEIMCNLVKYLGANQGGFFLIEMDDEEHQNDKFLKLEACYAWDRKKFINKRIPYGNGLVGQCVLERETIYMTDIPEDFVTITSGLGEANPDCLLIVPLKINDEIYGVVEIASFVKIENYMVDFVEKLAESIASTISTVSINIQTAKLLSESKLQAERLVQQEEEMRQNIEELQSTQEASDRKDLEISGLLDAVDTAFLRREYNVDGTIIFANQLYLDTMGYTKKEMIGKNLRSFIPPEGLEKFEKNWSEALKGNTQKGIIHRKTKLGRDIWMQMTYSPVYHKDGTIWKIAFFAMDVTAEHTKT